MEGKGTRLKLRGGTYYVVWTGNSRGTSTRTGSRQAAEQFLATFIQQRDADDAVTGKGLTVSQMLDDYLTEHARPKIAAIDQAEIAAGYLNAHFPVTKLASTVTEEDCDAYVAARRARRLKIIRDPKAAGNGTIRRELGMLVAAFNHAIKKKRLAPGSVPHITPPPAPRSKDRWLSIEEEAALIASCPIPPEENDKDGNPRRLTRIYRFIILAADTAARKEALTSLTWFQVDFDAGTIALNPADRLQTKKRRSVVPMSRRLRSVLERAFREKQNGYVLDHNGSIRTSFEGAVARARLEKVTPHTLRHTWATRAARAGVPMIDVADMLGDDLRTVEKNYRHQSPAHLKGAADWRDRETAPTGERQEEKA